MKEELNIIRELIIEMFNKVVDALEKIKSEIVIIDNDVSNSENDNEE